MTVWSPRILGLQTTISGFKQPKSVPKRGIMPSKIILMLYWKWLSTSAIENKRGQNGIPHLTTPIKVTCLVVPLLVYLGHMYILPVGRGMGNVGHSVQAFHFILHHNTSQTTFVSHVTLKWCRTLVRTSNTTDWAWRTNQAKSDQEFLAMHTSLQTHQNEMSLIWLGSQLWRWPEHCYSNLLGYDRLAVQRITARYMKGHD